MPEPDQLVLGGCGGRLLWFCVCVCVCNIKGLKLWGFRNLDDCTMQCPLYRRGHITLPNTELNCSSIPALWFCDFLNQTEGRLKLRTERHSRVYQMGLHMFISTITDLDLTTSPLSWSTPVASYLGPCFSSCYPTPHNQFFTQHPGEIFFDFFNRSITYI